MLEVDGTMPLTDINIAFTLFLLICFDYLLFCVDQEGYTKETVTTVHGKLTSHDIVPFGHFRDGQYLYISLYIIKTTLVQYLK